MGLYCQLIDTLHFKFRGVCVGGKAYNCLTRLFSYVSFGGIYPCVCVPDRLLPGQRGPLWLCAMQYCESCTSPRTPEHLLYQYHAHLRPLLWRHLHPDTHLMEQLFNVSPSPPPDPPDLPHTNSSPQLRGTCSVGDLTLLLPEWRLGREVKILLGDCGY